RVAYRLPRLTSPRGTPLALSLATLRLLPRLRLLPHPLRRRTRRVRLQRLPIHPLEPLRPCLATLLAVHVSSDWRVLVSLVPDSPRAVILSELVEPLLVSPSRHASYFSNHGTLHCP